MGRRKAQLRIEALTPHPAWIRLHGDGRVAFEPAGAAARVEHPVLSERDLPTAAGPVRELLLRRGTRLTGVPPRRRGTAYLVPAAVARAARGRDDLLFPLRERRDPATGTLVATALGRFEAPWWRRGPGWPPGRGIRRRPEASGDRTSLAVGLVLATALLAAGLGTLPVTLRDGLTAGGAAGVALGVATTVGLLLLGVAALGWSVRRLRARHRSSLRRGCAYLVTEEAMTWSHQERAAFLAELDREFARTAFVPGPRELGQNWSWSLAAEATRWERKVTELVQAFQAIRHNDDQVAAPSLFVWAPWPVACGFAARAAATAPVALRMRPHGGAGRGWPREPHLFRPAATGTSPTEPIPAGDAVREHATGAPGIREHHRMASLLVTDTSDCWSAEEALDAHGRKALVLVVRIGGGKWGPLPAVTAEPSLEPVTLQLEDAAGLGLAEFGRAELLEYSCGTAEDAPPPWPAYPELVTSVAEWIRRSVAEHRGAEVVLLGLAAPTEFATGLGIHAAHAAAGGTDAWPEHLWPLVYRGESGKPAFVVPALDLGTAPLAR